MSQEFSLVLDAQCALGESPVWWAAAVKLVFVDITGRKLSGFQTHSTVIDLSTQPEGIYFVRLLTARGWVAQRVFNR